MISEIVYQNLPSYQLHKNYAFVLIRQIITEYVIEVAIEHILSYPSIWDEYSDKIL